MKKHNKLARITLVLSATLLIVFFGLVLLEKNNVIKLFTNNDSASPTQEIKPVNNVSYEPATTTEQEEGDRIKQNLIDESNKPPEQNTKINISLSAATQDVAGGPLIVRSIVNANAGTCKLTLTQGSTKKEYTNEVTNLGTYYSCDGFDIPASDLSAGQWKLNLSVTNGQAYGEVSQEVNITK